MKRSNSNGSFYDPDAKKVKYSNKKFANDEGIFENLSRRLSVNTEHYGSKEVSTSYWLPYRKNNHVSYNAKKVVIPAVKETESFYERRANNDNFEFQALSRRLFVKTEPYDSEATSTSHWLPYRTNNHVSYNAEKVVIPAVKETELYERRANLEDNFEFGDLSRRSFVKSEPYDSEATSPNHCLPYKTDNHVSYNAEKVVIPAVKETESFYERRANHEGNFEFGALSRRLFVKTGPYNSEETFTSHQLPYRTENYVSNHAEKFFIPAVKETQFYERRTNNDSNFEFGALSRRPSEKTEPYDSEATSTSHHLPDWTDNHVSNDAEKIVIPTVGPTPIMIKISSNFEAHLKLVIEKFGEIRRKKVGIFIKLCPETYDMHQKLISFFAANNIQYRMPRKIRVFITGLPWYMRTQQIKDALTEKGFDVEEIVQVTEYGTMKPLSLFQAVLPNLNRNENILYLTNLLNLNISVGSLRSGRLRKCTIKRGAKFTHEKKTVKSETGIPKGINFCKTRNVISWDGREKFQNFGNNSFRRLQTTHTNIAQAKRRRKRRYFH